MDVSAPFQAIVKRAIQCNWSKFNAIARDAFIIIALADYNGIVSDVYYPVWVGGDLSKLEIGLLGGALFLAEIDV